MKADIKGCSTCETGKEKYESFTSLTLGKELIQYDYRTKDGELFSCVKPTLEQCRSLRDKWLLSKKRLIEEPANES